VFIRARLSPGQATSGLYACVSAGSSAHSMDGWLDGWIINAGEYGDATCIIHSLTPCPAFTTDTRALANTGAKTNNKTSGGTQHAQPLQTLVSGPGIRKVHLAVVP
jgi:hypothetical protein